MDFLIIVKNPLVVLKYSEIREVVINKISRFMR